MMLPKRRNLADLRQRISLSVTYSRCNADVQVDGSCKTDLGDAAMRTNCVMGKIISEGLSGHFEVIDNMNSCIREYCATFAAGIKNDAPNSPKNAKLTSLN